jgi:DNA-binding transcriptional ArsR family regulator
MTPAPARESEKQTEILKQSEDPDRVDTMLQILEDSSNRAILEATSEEPKSARELSECCDLALSTTYRKLNRLVDANLLEERRQIRSPGQHLTVFALRAADIQIHVSPGADFSIAISVTEARETATENQQFSLVDQVAD